MKRSVRKKMVKLEQSIEKDDTINDSIKKKLKKELFRKINNKDANFYDTEIKNNDDSTVGNDHSLTHNSKCSSNIYYGLSKISDPEEREKILRQRKAQLMVDEERKDRQNQQKAVFINLAPELTK